MNAAAQTKPKSKPAEALSAGTIRCSWTISSPTTSA